MKQLVQSIKNGELATLDVPEPIVAAGEVLIANYASLISAGTEKAVIGLAQKSLIGKALARPDHVRRVLVKMKNEGLLETLRQVAAKFDEPMALGYSSSGKVLACGSGVTDIKPGDRVASNGPHAGIVSVPRNLVAAVPDNVSYEEACFGVVGAIALQGIRRANISIGETALVIGLGLIGQLTALLLRGAGVKVIAVDPSGDRCSQVRNRGFDQVFPKLTSSQVLAMTRGKGVDAVLITAAANSNGPIELAADAVRRRGKVVLVGVTSLHLPREPFYKKEIEFTVSCSYGPGRYDPSYEQDGVDYPFGLVRWTEQRNIQCVIDLISTGSINVRQLISHRFNIDSACDAYTMISSQKEPHLGVILDYGEAAAVAPAEVDPTTNPRPNPKKASLAGVAVIGAGNFARLVMLPLLKRSKAIDIRAVVSARGLNAESLAKLHGIESRYKTIDAVYSANDIDTIFLLTRPDLHCEQVLQGLHAGKNVFVEKPLAINAQQLLAIRAAVAELGADCGILMTGFNRRFSQACIMVRDWFTDLSAPLTLTYRMNVGSLPPETWVHQPALSGGRFVSEACHAIDTATFLTQSLPQRIYAECVGGPFAPEITDDQAMVSIRHKNGSLSTIAYLAGGDRGMPKERIEVVGGGRMAVIDDFRRVTLAKDGRIKTFRTKGKGHVQEVARFFSATHSGGPWPIPFNEQFFVHAATFLAAQSMRDGLPWDLGRGITDASQTLGAAADRQGAATAA